jgi:hypothetical protein
VDWTSRPRVGGMQNLPETVVVAVGRLTVAATDLEFVLAWIGADQEGGDASKVFAKPGTPHAEAPIDEVVGRLDASRQRLETLIESQLESRASRQSLETLIESQLDSRASRP